MNNYIRLSFDKLESFDMHGSSLTSFVLIRNSLVSALTRQQNDFDLMYQQQDQEQDQEQDYELSDEEEQEVWLDSCFDQLDQDEDSNNNTKPLFDEYDSEEDDDDESMPLSPQENTVPFYKKKPTFFINEEDEEDEDGLICYDIPFLSL